MDLFPTLSDYIRHSGLGTDILKLLYAKADLFMVIQKQYWQTKSNETGITFLSAENSASG